MSLYYYGKKVNILFKSICIHTPHEHPNKSQMNQGFKIEESSGRKLWSTPSKQGSFITLEEGRALTYNPKA